ncbi:MAG: anaerobic ribonucleoside-triphosphate reductase activating protein [Candidatus Moranbacteria bacterium]|nr:anaerobic ribonucleoside-triphosphate reductase activating protein [Candidatus Moranbacteria bacterium]
MFKDLEIAGVEPSSMLERPGYISAIIFLNGCNFRCPFCHNPDLVLKNPDIKPYPLKEVLKLLKQKKGWVDSVILSGGEPTIYKEIPQFIKKVKDMGFSMGIHTNGTNPEMIKKLTDRNLLSYLAMDLKNDQQDYAKTAGLKKINFFNIQKTLNIIKSLDREKIETIVRITVVPGLIDRENIKKMGGLLKGIKKVSLQQFRPVNCLDKNFEKIKPYDKLELNKMADILEQTVEEVERGFI